MQKRGAESPSLLRNLLPSPFPGTARHTVPVSYREGKCRRSGESPAHGLNFLRCFASGSRSRRGWGRKRENLK